MLRTKYNSLNIRSATLLFKSIASILTCLFISCNLILFIFVHTGFAEDKIVAIVNNDVITQKDLNDFINFMRIQLSTQLQGGALEEKIQVMKRDLLDKLIDDRLLLQEAKKNNLKIDDNRIKAKLDEIKKNYASDNEFQNALSKQGLSQADIETRTREQLLMYNLIESKIKSKIAVSPAEVTDFYQKDRARFTSPEERDFQVITLKDESVTKEILDKLNSGQKVEDLVKEYSLDVSQLKTVKKGELKKEIEDAVSKLKPQEASEPIKSEDNQYIFILKNITPSQQLNLSEVQEQIYAFLYDKKMQEALLNFLVELKKQSYVKVFDN